MSDSSLTVGSDGPRKVVIDRGKETGGYGLESNVGQLLPAVGGCYSNDILLESGERGISVRNVQVRRRADWSGEPVRAPNVSFDVALAAEATPEDISDLIQHADRFAEMPDALRFGTEVKLAQFKAIPLP